MSTPDLRVLFNNYIDNTEALVDEAVFFDADGTAWTPRHLETFSMKSKAWWTTAFSTAIGQKTLPAQWKPFNKKALPLATWKSPPRTSRFYSIRPDRYPAPNRFWRDLEESKTDVKVNVSKPVFCWSRPTGRQALLWRKLRQNRAHQARRRVHLCRFWPVL